MTQGDESDSFARWVVENDRVAIYLPRSVVEGGTSLILDGYPPGLVIESAGVEINVPHWRQVQAGVEYCVANGDQWIRCGVPGLESEVAVRSDRIVGIIGPR